MWWAQLADPWVPLPKSGSPWFPPLMTLWATHCDVLLEWSECPLELDDSTITTGCCSVHGTIQCSFAILLFFVSRALVSLSLSVTGKKRREG